MPESDALNFSSAGFLLVTGGYDHTLKLWDVGTTDCLRSFDHPNSQVNALAFTPDKKIVAAAGYQNIRFYDVSAGASTDADSSAPQASPPIMTYEGYKGNITSIGFQANGQWMFIGCDDGFARILDLRQDPNQRSQTLQQLNSSSPLPSGPGTAVNCVALLPNQVELLVGDQSGGVHICDIRMAIAQLRSLPREPSAELASVQSVTVDMETTLLAAVNSRGVCTVWNARAPAGTIAASASASFAASTSTSSTAGAPEQCATAVSGVPVASGVAAAPLTVPTLKTQFVAHPGVKPALKVLFSPDSTLMATSSADCSARIWRTSDLPSNLLQRGAEDVARAARSEAGRRARPTPADEDGGGVGGLRPRDTVGRSELRPIVVLRDPTARWVWDCAFAADSQYLFTASSDGVARLWHVDSGEVVRRYTGHTRAILALAYSE